MGDAVRGDAVRASAARCRAARRNRGTSRYVVKTTGTASMRVRRSARRLAATLDAQRALPTVSEAPQVRSAPAWPASGSGGRHRGDDYGPVVDRSARLIAAAHAASPRLAGTPQALRDRLPPDVALRDIGERRLPGLVQNEHVSQVVSARLRSDFPHCARSTFGRTTCPTAHVFRRPHARDRIAARSAAGRPPRHRDRARSHRKDASRPGASHRCHHGFESRGLRRACVGPGPSSSCPRSARARRARDGQARPRRRRDGASEAA